MVMRCFILQSMFFTTLKLFNTLDNNVKYIVRFCDHATQLQAHSIICQGDEVDKSTPKTFIELKYFIYGKKAFAVDSILQGLRK